MAKDKTLGVSDLAKALGVEEASARVVLRKQEIGKKGRSYEFSRGQIDAIVKKHSAGASKTEKKAPKKGKKKIVVKRKAKTAESQATA